MSGVDRATLDYMLARFEASPKFSELGDRTPEDYRYCRGILQDFRNKLGIPFAHLRRASITPPVVQRLVDKIAETHPAKANHVKRYLSAAYRWGGLRMGVRDNPARGVEQASERGEVVVPEREAMEALVAFLRARGILPSRRK